MQMLGGKGDAGGGGVRRSEAAGVSDTTATYDEPPFQDDDIPF